ncbi:hypothetical protein EDC40_105300 [Aminobacter aminovorans]|uniref:DUF4440 domain-containing protein n=1 Tax=Aminobacter aminovorans TaxID=83263 RepID=A0A380WMS5_AMIAI|nr:hypothetical protein [Aminobacter aminovorans]TCS26099.1 hypothetical protein EDC40_105300 [Aminobacter aminovorans]SUU90237.1 Uncharacterised protein [Aminobacter aminovorans]
MTVNRDELLELEREFWTGDQKFFAENADRECLVAFPEMSGVMSNAELAATATKPHRWRNLEMKVQGIVEPGSDIVMLTYEAKAIRDNGEPYQALVSTGYVHRLQGWKMMFHAQTPIANAGKTKG